MKISNQLRALCIMMMYIQKDWDAKSRMTLLRSEYTNVRRWNLTCYLLAKGKLTNKVVKKLAKRSNQEGSEDKLIDQKRNLLYALEDSSSPLCGLIECIFESNEVGRVAVKKAMEEICTKDELNTHSAVGMWNSLIDKEMWSFYQAWSHAREVQELEDMLDS